MRPWLSIFVTCCILSLVIFTMFLASSYFGDCCMHILWFNMFWLHLLNLFQNVTFITTNLQYPITNGKQSKCNYWLLLTKMINNPNVCIRFSVEILFYPLQDRPFKSTILDPMIIWFSFSASCGLFRNGSCSLVFYWEFERSRCSEVFT